MKLNSNTLTNVTNTTQLDNRAFETLSLKVAEVQSLLAFLTDSDNLPERESLTVSVLERLTEWLQSDIQAMQAAFVSTTTAGTVDPDTVTDLHYLLKSMFNTFLRDEELRESDFSDALELADSLGEQVGRNTQ